MGVGLSVSLSNSTCADCKYMTDLTTLSSMLDGSDESERSHLLLAIITTFSQLPLNPASTRKVIFVFGFKLGPIEQLILSPNH